MSGEWQNPLPLQGWFLVTQSRALGCGAVLGIDLPNTPLVVYRTAAGVVRAVAAHCPHMGTHLRNATVEGETLRCPLHHWQWTADAANPPENDIRCLAGYPVQEACDGVWIFNQSAVAENKSPGFPAVPSRKLHFRHGRPVFLRCPWQAVVANAFDLNHFETVHERALLGVPEIEDQGESLEFRYNSQTTGQSFPDRVMRKLSGNRIEVTIRCWHGSVLMIQTKTQQRETFLWLNFLPVDGGTLVKPIYAVTCGGLPGASALRLRISAWLFQAFLRKDISILDQMKFAPTVSEQEDPYFNAYLRFIKRQAAQIQP